MATKKPTAKKATTRKNAAATSHKKIAPTKTKVTTLKATDDKAPARSVEAPAEPKTARNITARRLPRLSAPTTPLIAAVVAEFFGTFLLAAAYITGQGQPIPLLFATIGIVFAVGLASGAHLNPAITLAAFVTKKINKVRAATYVVAQFMGAIVALGVLTTFVGGAPEVNDQLGGLGATPVALFGIDGIPTGSELYVLFAELLGAVILGFIVATGLSRAADRVTRSLTYGFGLFAALFIAGSAAAFVGGVSVLNPAAAVALSAIEFNVWALSVYLLAPLLGVIIGFVLQDILSRNEDVTSTT